MFTASPQSLAPRFRALDGWRGVCALLVALHHIEVHGWIYWQPLVRNAWLFVDFFFVLSGFVIAHAYGARLGDARGVRDFVVRRLGRLYPLHVVMLSALVALELTHLMLAHIHPIAGERAAFIADRSPFAVLTNLFLVQAMGLHDSETWNGPAWSISCEFYAYLVFAAVCFFTPGRKARLILSALLAVAGVVVLARFSDYGMRETFHWAIFRCLYGFFTGVLAYEAWRAGVLRALRGTAAEIAALVLIAAFVVLAPGMRALEYLATPLFAAVVLVFAGDSGAVSRLLTLAPAAALGRWSYSIYMVHTFVLASLFSGAHVVEGLFHRAWLIHQPNGWAALDLGSDAANILLTLAFLAAVVALSALTYRFVERPGQALFARFAAPKRPLLAAQAG
jgi:peptidoglycan/LPS O-acetylase OafA/YrhL